MVTERVQEDPTKENMNNFHCHMPGGIYRPADEGDNHGFRGIRKMLLDEYGSYLDEPEEFWPPADRRIVRSLKVGKEIQAAIDEILNEDFRLQSEWDQVKGDADGGLPNEIRERVLRPVYLRLRSKFSQEDLSK